MKTPKLLATAVLAIATSAAFADNTVYTGDPLQTPRGREHKASIVRYHSDFTERTSRPYGNARMWEHHPDAARYPLWYKESVRYQNFENDPYLDEPNPNHFERPSMSGKDPRFDTEWREMRDSE